jgi:hypothetical protein
MPTKFHRLVRLVPQLSPLSGNIAYLLGKQVF